MKVQYFGKQKNMAKGSSTLEILIAFAILILMLTAVILLSIGSQSLAVDNETNNEALNKAKGLLETARAQSRQDFSSLINSSAGDTIYSKSLTVQDLTPCEKQATSTVSWNIGGTKTEKIELSTLFTDLAGFYALGGDCDVNPPSGGWSLPNTLISRDFTKKSYDNPSVNSAAGIQASGIDVINHIIYMSAWSNKDNFYILDATDLSGGNPPPIKGSLNIGNGLNAVDSVRDSVSGKTYSFALLNDNQHQLQVIEVTNKNNPQVIASSTLPNITFSCSPASDPCLSGQSIFYYKGYIYIGTAYIANLALPPNKNNEFHIYCVLDSTVSGCSPSTPKWMGSVNVNHNINAITVSGHYAFLATSDDNAELTVIDLNNLNATPITLDLPGSEDGTSLYLVGNTLYLGRERTASSRSDFYILNIQNPNSISISGSIYLNQNSNTEIADIVVSGRYAFLALTDQTNGFQVLDVSKPTNILSVGKYNYSESATGIEYDDGFIYTSNKKNDALRIIRPAECADKLDDDGDGKIDIKDPQCHTDGNAANISSYNPEDDNE